MFTKDKKREGAKKRPAPGEARPAGRSAQGEAKPRKRPAEAAPQQKRRPAPEQKRRPAAAQRPAPERRRGETPVRPAPRSAVPQDRVPDPVPAGEDQVYAIQQPPRKTPSTGSRRRPEPAKRGRKAAAAKQPPQGTSYHRSTPKQKKTLRDLFIKKDSKYYRDPDQQAEAARARKAARAEQKERIRDLAKKLDTPAIVYTEPKPFNRNRLVIQLVTVLAVAAAFVMGLSVFFKVKVVQVSGADTYSAYAIQQASGIKEGDNLLTFGRARASGLITANLPYINSVRIGIKLPDTVNIEVEEVDVAYSIQSGDGDWWLITSGGKVVKQIPGSTAKNYTKIMGVQVEKPEVNHEITAVEAAPDPSEETKEQKPGVAEPPVTVTGAMKLKAVLQILRALEDNDIVGDAATVNVENLEKIELWYGQRYQVNLGDASNLDYKIACMVDVILQFEDYQTGMLDISFTKKADQVIYTPFV